MAATILGFMTGVAMLGRISGGYIGDVIGMKPTLVVCFILMTTGALILATASTVQQAMVFAVVYGLGYGARAPILIALRGEYFGARNFATIMGMSQPLLMIGIFIGPVAAGFAYDMQGSYTMSFTIISFLNLFGAILVLFIKKPKNPNSVTVSEQTR
jgi:MFS family permease